MLESFIQSQVKSMRREGSPGVPNAVECLEVVRVAPTSVAAHAGIQPGDLLQSIGGRAASNLGVRFANAPVSERRYQLYAPATGERLRLETTGIDIGISVRPTAAGIAAAAVTVDPDPASLILLWETGKWASLEKLCAQVLEPRGGGLVSRMLGKRPERDTPAVLLLGASLYERGKKKEGLALVREYEAKWSRHYPMSYMAVSRYYQAREAFAAGRTAQATDHLSKAIELNPASERVADAIESTTGTRPSRPLRWMGRVLPLDYDLDTLDGGVTTRISLSRVLTGLPPEKLFVLCFLADTRGNTAYNDFMLRFTGFMTYFGDYLHGLHVVTKEGRRRVETPENYKAEDNARMKGLPFNALWDKDGKATDRVGPLGSPWIFLVDGRLRVFHEGELEGPDLWDGLVAAAQAPRD